MKKILLLFFAVFLLTACSKEVVPTINVISPQENDVITITNYDRKLTFTTVPERVLTFGPNCTELFVALGLGDLIIGNTLDNHSRGALPEFEKIYDSIPELNYGSATREAVLTSGADFIYGIDWEFGSEAIDLEELQEYGITAYVNRASSFEQLFKEIDDIGKIFQIEDRTSAFIEDQQKRLASVITKNTSDVKPSVLVYDSGGSGVFTASGSNFENLIIEAAGGTNIFGDLREKQWLTVSYENILERKPEYIIIHDYDSPSIETKIAEIKAHPVLSQLDSVKDNRFIILPLESVLPGNRIAHTVEFIAEQLQSK